jgi:hypothetical protein
MSLPLRTAWIASSAINGVGTSTYRPPWDFRQFSGTSTTFGSSTGGFSSFSRQLLRALATVIPRQPFLALQPEKAAYCRRERPAFSPPRQKKSRKES